jgi:hypothetical protein
MSMSSVFRRASDPLQADVEEVRGPAGRPLSHRALGFA